MQLTQTRTTPGNRPRRLAATEPPLRVVIAEDLVVLREGMVRLLEDAGVDVVAQAGNAVDLLSKVRSHVPDVAVVDVRMPPTHTTEGIEAAIEIRRELPEIAVLVFSQHFEARSASDFIRENPTGVGYLLKERVLDLKQFTSALRRVARGDAVLDPEVVAELMRHNLRSDPIATLTEREREVIALMAEGFANQAIADRLVISRGAVEHHCTNIFSKLEIDEQKSRRVQAVLKYLDRK